MPKLKPVTDAEVIACFKAQENALMEMQEFSYRMRQGAVERFEMPEAYARQFALIACAAGDMVVSVLGVHTMQQQRDEIARLKKETK